jgi:hypothetical protein
MPRGDLIQFRRGDSSTWTSVNPVLADGEVGLEKDTGQAKIGNGTQDWNTLSYAFGGGGSSVVSVNGLSGIVTLDTDDIEEGLTNLYFTNLRATTALTGANISIFTNDVGYLTAETDTLQSVTDRGSSTTNTITVSPSGNNDAIIANGSGSGSGIDITHNGSGSKLKISGSGSGDLIESTVFNVDRLGNVEGNSFITDGGANTQVVAGDGSLLNVSDIGGSPAGNNGELQYNSSGSFAAISDSFYNSTTGYLGLGIDSPEAKFDLNFNGLPNYTGLPISDSTPQAAQYRLTQGDVTITGAEAERQNVQLDLKRLNVESSSMAGTTSVPSYYRVSRNELNVDWDNINTSQNDVTLYTFGLENVYNFQGDLNQSASYYFSIARPFENVVTDKTTNSAGQVYASEIYPMSNISNTTQLAEGSGFMFQYIRNFTNTSNLANVSGDFIHRSIICDLNSNNTVSNFDNIILEIDNACTKTSKNFAIKSNRGTTELSSGTAGIKPFIVKAANSQTANITEWQNSSGTAMSYIRPNGSMKPASLADSAAANDSIYYSTTQSKLVYKDSSGTVNNLY